ncbi:hypothetical protein GQ43DRAFT_423670 [Delitschia confertaspora ATCC 74209]|uniref:EF-hand domain-containing protein n=1 Tax=Delitschia confertaspora ATCC 74209 TaxID=1513339 RepID=A0A9P4MP52_9PLEO|nr:hypothetical protein GQ43DRAFT_423670 [Delitschia confertaspora ATCC 74209]
MSTTPTPYKPSPLSFNSPRRSPFQRSHSPLAPSPSTVRPSTPTSSPLKPSTPSQSSPFKPSTPSQLTPLRQSTTGNASNNPPAWLNTRGTSTVSERPVSPTRQDSSSTVATVIQTKRPTVNSTSYFDGAAPPVPSSSTPPSRPVTATRTKSSDSLSHIPPPLLHSMRESFSVLDRGNSGSVNADDVADMLSQLGLTASPASLSTYFPSGTQTMNLATYLHTLADLLSGLSHPSELNAAFEAFDDDDSGQIDLGELKDALFHTAPEAGEKRLTEREIDMVVDGFSGRRAFGKGGKSFGRGEVFRYGEFVASVTGGGGNAGDNGSAAAGPS